MSRKRKKGFIRSENTREERISVFSRDLLTFSFKDLDETQPKNNPQSLTSWNEDNLLKIFIKRLRELSKLTRDEAIKQQQIKIYGDFPINTDYYHPKHVDDNVTWSVIKAVGGQKGVIAGYIVESTFFIVFLDQNHRFWVSKKKHT
ncbi:MAG: hypothetical protein D3924_07825 [Candidatus Electrothrix sp. AR4]|nr:hypothetical protein [Candidatus Electrothrix sp. AR4]